MEYSQLLVRYSADIMSDSYLGNMPHAMCVVVMCIFFQLEPPVPPVMCYMSRTLWTTTSVNVTTMTRTLWSAYRMKTR